MEPYVIGIDIGTGSTKACAVALSGAVLANSQVHYGMLQTKDAFSEQDPEIIWQAFVKTIQTIVEKVGAAPSAISLSSCMHSLILIDAAGLPLTPNITWADRRSAAIAEALRNAPEGKIIYTATGTPVHAMSPLCKLRWFRDQEPERFTKISKAISIKEYIWHKLFGVYEIDHSLASATGLFDVSQLLWFPLSLHYCGVQATQLSTPVATQFVRNTMHPEMASFLHLPQEIPVCIGGSDGCLANVGSNALQAGTAAVTIGTSGAVRISSQQPIAVFPEMIFNYRLDEQTFICGGAVNNGGNMVQWLSQQFLGNPILNTEAYTNLFNQAEGVPPGSDGLICLPYLYGERTPIWDEQACGSFFGVRAQHGQAHFIRAGLEGVCFALYGILKKLEASAETIHTLHISGGMVHSPAWMQLLADSTGKKLCLLHTDDASAIGAALMGFKAIGLTNTYITNGALVEKIIEPNKKNHQVYLKSYAVFQELYRALKPVMHRARTL